MSVLKLISNYLTKRKQRTRINNSCSSWEDILFDIPQRSTLGSILFNTFLSDLLFIEFANHADDNTVYRGGDSIVDVFLSLQDSAKKVFHWFFHNTGKCHLLLRKNDKIKLEVGDSFIKNGTSEKFLSVKIDNKLSLAENVKNICIRKKIANWGCWQELLHIWKLESGNSYWMSVLTVITAY